MIDRKKLDPARNWAEWAQDQELGYDVRAAVDVIQSLPDQWIDANKVREVLDMWAGNPSPTSDEVAVLNDFEALLTPPLPSLAELIEQGHSPDEYQWMQAELAGSRTWFIIGESPTKPGRWILSTPNGRLVSETPEYIVPLPDLPRLEWPRTDDATPTTETPPAETVDNPSSDTSADPEPQPGEAWLVNYRGAHYEALYWYSPIYAHWALALNREGLTTIEAHEATPMHRLVPEVQA